MATRFYLSSSATAPPNSPGFAAWTRTTEGVRRKMQRGVKDSSAMTSKTIWANGAAAGNESALAVQYASNKLAIGTAFATTDTVKGYIRALESATNDNINRVAFALKVYNGTTLQATLKALGFYGAAVNEWDTVLENRIIADGDALDTNYTTVDGDYLVLEIGGQAASGGGTSVTGTLSFGEDNASDLPEDETTQTALNPWFEISRTFGVITSEVALAGTQPAASGTLSARSGGGSGNTVWIPVDYEAEVSSAVAAWAPAYASTTTSELAALLTKTGANYDVRNALMRFYTASLNGLTVASAVLRLYASGSADQDSRSIVGDYHAFTPPAGSGDYTTAAPTGALGPTTIASIATGASKDYALTSPNSNLDKTGYTGLRATVNGGQPTVGNNYVLWNGRASGGQIPTLVITLGGVVALAGTQPAASGTLSKVQSRAIAGAQPAASGTLAKVHSRALAGAQPAASGSLSSARYSAAALDGTQPAASGALTVLQSRALAGTQPAASGALGATQALNRSLAGTQPAAGGALTKTQSRGLASTQPAATGALTKTHARALAGTQPAATGALTLLQSRALAGTQPAGSGALTATQALYRSLAGTQPAASGALSHVQALQRALAGTQPPAAGALAKTQSLYRSTSGTQPAASGALTKTHARALAGTQPAATGTLASVAARTLTGLQPAASGALSVEVIGDNDVTLTGTQPAATGALAKVQTRSLAGVQGAASGTLTYVRLGALVLGRLTVRPAVTAQVTTAAAVTADINVTPAVTGTVRVVPGG